MYPNDDWRELREFPGYYINREGQVYNYYTDHYLSTRRNQAGLCMVSPSVDGKQLTRMVSHLVAEAFLEPHQRPDFISVIHLNGDKSDCNAENLAWRPRWYTIVYHQQFNKPEYPGLLYLRDTDEVMTYREAAVRYGLIEKRLHFSAWNNEPCWPTLYTFVPYRE